MNRITMISVSMAAMALTGCGLSSKDSSRLINAHEAKALTEEFYWRKSDPRVDHISDEELTKIIIRAADPTLDGERAELSISAAAVALASVGDKRFARVLSIQPPTVIAATTDGISSLWTRYKLSYPETQKLWESYKHLRPSRE
ncbi:MAG: hypothetical protein QM755_22380 [Luteolibacter sp.]